MGVHWKYVDSPGEGKKRTIYEVMTNVLGATLHEVVVH